MNEPKVGSTLKNGATLLAIKPSPSRRLGEAEGSVVLATWDNGSGTEYVTWFMDLQGHCGSGHYHHSLVLATKEYDARS